MNITAPKSVYSSSAAIFLVSDDALVTYGTVTCGGYLLGRTRDNEVSQAFILRVPVLDKEAVHVSSARAGGMRPDTCPHLGTATKTVSMYSESSRKYTLVTISASDLTERFPL